MSARRRSDAAVHDYRVRTWHQPIVAMLLLTALIIGIGCLPTVAQGMTYHQARYHTSQAKVRSLIRAEAHTWHYGTANREALVKLAYRESRWHPWSRSGMHGCWGTFQLRYTMCLGHPWWDATWNTHRAIVYIRHRYGTPVRALAHSLARGWY